ncbi:hypothetical protein COCON_G00075930 [Conger conger]|uniref:Replication factor A C-terminal domain-containing protein n=1 Tax=Conger conger TaxID=82655 RepID=A0A9Q1I1G6_CONCO|nr:hypothetical protein COCON_G00075930 [Conger conger]
MQIICSVLSLRDSCVIYPSCPQCVSRLQKKQSELRCQKCGTRNEENISYRYRLSLNVKRCSDIFGVTVFGSCLNPYFGIPAVGLQRFFDKSLKNAGDPQSDCVHRLLLKAVEDCFVGRQFEFRIKLPGHEAGERSLFNEQGLHALLASNRISREFVTSRITLPNGAAGGSSVLSYFKKLLQTSCDVHVSGFPYPERPPASIEQVDLALQSFECSLASFNRSSLWHSYWKQSPGIITSSAEQEEKEPNGADAGSQWRCRKSLRPQTQKCSHSTPSYVPSPQCCSVDVKGEVSYKDSSQGSCLGFLVCHDSRETVESSLPNRFQGSGSLLPDTLELTSSVTESGNCKSPKPSKVEQVELEQNEPLCLKLGWRGGFSEGKDDMLSFQDGLSVCGWNSNLSNSSAWEDLPFSESWGEFISKANTLSEVSQKNKACDPAKRMEAEMSKTGCVDEIYRHANVSSSTEHSCNFRTTSYVHRAQVKEQASTAVVRRSFIKSAGLCFDMSGNHNVKQNSPHVHMSPSDHFVEASEDLERGKGDLAPLVPGLRALTAQGQCNRNVKNKIKEFSCVDEEAKKQGTVFHSNQCISEHKLDGHGASWEFGWDEQTLLNRQPFTKDAYNASADLFGSYQNSVGIVEEEDKTVTPPSEYSTLKLLKSCRPLLHKCGDHSTPIEKIQKPSTDKCMLGSDISDPLDFVPFSQSTPISGNLMPLRRLPHRGKDQRPSRLVLRGNVSWHHGYSKTESEIKRENMTDCGSEDAAPLSVGKITYSSNPWSLTRSIKRHEHVDRYCCKRIILASGGKYSCKKLEDCVKSAHFENEGQRITAVVSSPEHAAKKNSCLLDTSTSCLCTDQNSAVLDWSADLFADSFGN